MAFAMITSIMSTIGMMMFISNVIPKATTFPFATETVDTIAPLPPILTTTTTEKPIDDDLINQCPNGMFQCWLNQTKKSNHLFDDYLPEFQALTIPSFICIDRSRVCDGHHDCPNGQDESDDQCHPNKPDNHTVIASGCYLCRNSTEICIVMSKLCNNHPDCPLGDDENECQNSKHPILSSSYESRFSANQYGPTNINIVNRDSGNLEKNPILPPNNSNDAGMEPLRDGDKNLPTNNQPSVQDGVGFQFRVNNFVVYNSVVKMFNQDSDNVASKEAEQSTSTETYPHHHYPNNNNNYSRNHYH